MRNDIIRIDNTTGSKLDSMRHVYLKDFNTIYSIKINTAAYDSEFILTENFKNELGFETYIDLDRLPIGKHILKVNRYSIKKSDTTHLQVASIPFWHFKD